MMHVITFFLLLAALRVGSAHALTVDEIIKLKQAGVGDSTIELLIARDAARAQRMGVIRQDGWIVHTTDTRDRSLVNANDSITTTYPIDVYPWAGALGAPTKGRRGMPRPMR
jgi:hypothetical protein